MPAPHRRYPEARNRGSASWSADRQTLVFGRQHWLESGSSTSAAIEELDLRTHQLTEIPDSKDMIVPVVSPDGKYLAAKHTTAKPDSAIYDFAAKKMDSGEHHLGLPTLLVV